MTLHRSPIQNPKIAIKKPAIENIIRAMNKRGPYIVKSVLVNIAYRVIAKTIPVVKDAASRTIFGLVLWHTVATQNDSQTVNVNSKMQLIGTFWSNLQQTNAQIVAIRSIESPINNPWFYRAAEYPLINPDAANPSVAFGQILGTHAK